MMQLSSARRLQKRLSGSAVISTLSIIWICLTTSKHVNASCDQVIPNHENCTRIQVHSLDASTSALPWNFVFIARNVQISTAKGGAVAIHLPRECDYKALDPLHGGKQLSQYNVSTERQPDCKRVPGTWLLAQDAAHSQQNMFEELGMMWYPAFLASKHSCNLDKSTMRITHIGGTRRGWLAYDDVYRALGSYMPWEMLHSGGAIFGNSKVTGCLEFETALLVEASYSWHTKTVANHYNQRLAAFAHAVVDGVGVRHVKPHKCRKHMTIATRNRPYRNITNMEAIVAAVRVRFPELRLTVQDMAGLPMKEQVQLARETDIFVFPHGGAGPLVMFLPPGAAVIELFPYGFVDPLYRNMAVMTNHVYFVWQSKDIDKAQDLERLKRDSNTEVDIPSLLTVMQSAVHVTAASTLDSFLGYDGNTLNSTLCPWCGNHQVSSCTRPGS